MATDESTITPNESTPNGSALNSIPFEDIIGGPLVACVDAQAEASRATMEYIKEFTMTDSDVDIYAKQPIMISFSFEVDGIKNLITLPLMTIVPIPYMRIDNVNLSFAASVTSLTNENFEAKYSSNIYKAEESSSNSVSTESCIHIAIKAGTMNMPSGMAKLLDYFNNNLIQHKTLTLEDIEQLKAENQEKIRKREENSGQISSEEIAEAKTAAKQEINDAATKATNEINQLQNLSNEERKKVIAEIESIKADSNSSIETTTSPSYITNISKKAVSNINKKVNNAQSTDQKIKRDKEEQEKIAKEKAAAKQAITDKANEAKKAIDQLQNLTDEDYSIALSLINEAIAKYNDGIERSTTISLINTAEKNAIKRIDDVIASADITDFENKTKKEEQERIANDVAIEQQQLVQIVKDAQDTINEYKHLTDKEREEALSNINNTSEKASTKIGKATQLQEAEDYRKEAEASIEKELQKTKATNLANAKTAAKQSLKDKAAEAKAELHQLTSLSADTLNKADTEIDGIVISNNVEIDKAEDTSLIDSLQANATFKIDTIVADNKEIAYNNSTSLPYIKKETQNSLTNKAQNAKSDIDQFEHLPDNEKDEAKDTTDCIVTSWNRIIDKIRNTTTVKKAKKIVEARIDEEIKKAEFADQKTKEKQALHTKENQAKASINQLKKLSSDEKQTRYQKIEEIVTKENKAIERMRNRPLSELLSIRKNAEVQIDKIVNAAKDANSLKK